MQHAHSAVLSGFRLTALLESEYTAGARLVLRLLRDGQIQMADRVTLLPHALQS